MSLRKYTYLKALTLDINDFLSKLYNWKKQKTTKTLTSSVCQNQQETISHINENVKHNYFIITSCF